MSSIICFPCVLLYVQLLIGLLLVYCSLFVISIHNKCIDMRERMGYVKRNSCYISLVRDNVLVLMMWRKG